MSQEGLLKTLLYRLTQQIIHEGTDPNILKTVFPDRWDQFDAFGGGREPFTWSQLKRGFEALLNDTSKYFFLAIDGLDEFGSPDVSELVNLIIQVADLPNVKVCTASRPWQVFEDAFHSRPSLRLENLTRNDIRRYVISKFNASRYYVRLLQDNEDIALLLVDDITKKASGVFLWVYLVVKSLLTGISNADTMSELQERLDALPSDLEDLFDKLLEKVEPRYYQQACRFIRLLYEQTLPTLLDFWFANDEDTQSSLSAPARLLSVAEARNCMDQMERRIKSRCKGLLEIQEHTVQGGQTNREQWRVGYLHRTAKDYLLSDRMHAKILDATKEPPYNPRSQWANAYLWSLKTRIVDERNWSCWEQMTGGVEFALRLQHEDGQVRVTYLNEVFQAAMKNDENWTQYPVEYAAYLGLHEYVCIKVRFMKTRELREILQRASHMRIYEKRNEIRNNFQFRTFYMLQAKVFAADNRKKNGTDKCLEVMRHRSKSIIHRTLSLNSEKGNLPYV